MVCLGGSCSTGETGGAAGIKARESGGSSSPVCPAGGRTGAEIPGTPNVGFGRGGAAGGARGSRGGGAGRLTADPGRVVGECCRPDRRSGRARIATVSTSDRTGGGSRPARSSPGSMSGFSSTSLATSSTGRAVRPCHGGRSGTIPRCRGIRLGGATCPPGMPSKPRNPCGWSSRPVSGKRSSGGSGLASGPAGPPSAGRFGARLLVGLSTGTITRCWHTGHRPFLPARWSGTSNRWPNGHKKRIATYGLGCDWSTQRQIWQPLVGTSRTKRWQRATTLGNSMVAARRGQKQPLSCTQPSDRTTGLGGPGVCGARTFYHGCATRLNAAVYRILGAESSLHGRIQTVPPQ